MYSLRLLKFAQSVRHLKVDRFTTCAANVMWYFKLHWVGRGNAKVLLPRNLNYVNCKCTCKNVLNLYLNIYIYCKLVNKEMYIRSFILRGEFSAACNPQQVVLRLQFI